MHISTKRPKEEEVIMQNKGLFCSLSTTDICPFMSANKVAAVAISLS